MPDSARFPVGQIVRPVRFGCRGVVFDVAQTPGPARHRTAYAGCGSGVVFDVAQTPCRPYRDGRHLPRAATQ